MPAVLPDDLGRTAPPPELVDACKIIVDAVNKIYALPNLDEQNRTWALRREAIARIILAYVDVPTHYARLSVISDELDRRGPASLAKITEEHVLRIGIMLAAQTGNNTMNINHQALAERIALFAKQHPGQESSDMVHQFALATAAKRQVILYSQFGAVGDGITDDFDAIVRAHAVANEMGLPVKADEGKTYYIGASTKTATIQTDTDWTGAKFIIDDSKVALRDRGSRIFSVTSKHASFPITATPFKKGQTKFNVDWGTNVPQDIFVEARDNTTMRLARFLGGVLSDGEAQRDIFILDKDGNVDPTTPIIWDFDNVSSMTAYPIDPGILTIKGGHFTTIANQVDSASYYERNILINRSNVVLDGITCAVTGELERRSPYQGFIYIRQCTNVTVQNTVFGTHTDSGSGGSYAYAIHAANNVTLKNCTQTGDIFAPTSEVWGSGSSSYSKNLVYDNVILTAIGTHRGYVNATVKNSVLGRRVRVLGWGDFLIENTVVYSASFLNLRSEYGSWFDGEIVIRNCEYHPTGTSANTYGVLIHGSNNGQMDFKNGILKMPRKITIDGLIIHDTNPPSGYLGPKIFANFTPNYTERNVQNGTFEWQYPFVITEEVEIRNLTVKSGLPLTISTNPWMFRNVKVTRR